ncbi:protein of unknown function [Pararobbsia alpina]
MRHARPRARRPAQTLHLTSASDTEHRQRAQYDAGRRGAERADLQPGLAHEQSDRRERNRNLHDHHGLRPAVVTMQQRLALLVGFLDLRLERLGLLANRFLLRLVARGLTREMLERLGIVPRQLRAEVGEVLLLALRLVVRPLIRGVGLADRRFVLVVQRKIFRIAALVRHHRADGREHSRHHGHARRHRVRTVRGVFRRVLDRVIVRSVYFEIRHSPILPAIPAVCKARRMLQRKKASAHEAVPVMTMVYPVRSATARRPVRDAET